MRQDQIEINSQDVIDALASQRNSTLDEIARMGAIIRALNREIEKLSVPTSGSGGDQGPG